MTDAEVGYIYDRLMEFLIYSYHSASRSLRLNPALPVSPEVRRNKY